MGWAGALGDVLTLSGDTTQYVYHYTTAAGYAGISASGMILPSADGYTYVTPNVYSSGQQAQSSLALRQAPIGYFAVPVSNIPPSALPPSVVEPYYGQPGGGIEIKVPSPVSTDGGYWQEIGK